jgi:hypothetical protein
VLTTDGWNPWTLDDSENRQRYTKSDVRRGQTEFIQCRADSFHVRRIDEIVASRIDPTLKTKSDVLQDALAMWLEDWDKRYPDGSGGELAYRARLMRMERKRAFREEFMESAGDQLEALQRDGDALGMSEFLQIMLQAQGDFKDDAPSSYLSKVEDMIQRARRMLDAIR